MFNVFEVVGNKNWISILTKNTLKRDVEMAKPVYLTCVDLNIDMYLHKFILFDII